MKTFFRIMLLLLAFAMPGESWAGKYIKEFAIATSTHKFFNSVTSNDRGFTYVDYDLNRKAGGNYIYLCYKTTDDPSQAVTDLVVFEKGPGGYDKNMPKEYTYNGRTYKPVPVPYDDDNGDLNRGAGGRDLYLWYTKDKYEEGVITTDLKVTSNKRVAGNVIKANNEGGPCDFNQGAGGDDIYLTVVKALPEISEIPAFNEMFDVTRIGGGLYKIDIPLANVKDEQSTYVLSFSNLTSKIKAVDSKNKARDLFSVKGVHPYKMEYTNDWKVTIDMLQSDIEYYDPNTLEKITGTREITVKSSNKTDRVWASFLCKLPADYDKFSLNAEGTINYQGSKSVSMTMNTLAHKVITPEDINSITVVDPVISVYFDGMDDADRQPQGTQKVQIVSNNLIYRGKLWNIDRKEFVGDYESKDGDHNINLNLMSTDSLQSFALVMQGGYSSETPATGTVVSKPEAVYVANIDLKPFHEVSNLNVFTTREVDSKGVYSQKDTITWTVKNFGQGDVIDNDEFLIQRAHKADFSDAVTLGNVSLSDGTVDTDDDNNMNFKFGVEDEESWYDSDKSNNNPKVYYRVVRAFAYSLWDEGCDEKYMKTGSVDLQQQLADVVGISVRKPDASEIGGHNTDSKVTYSFINCQGKLVNEDDIDHDGHYGGVTGSTYVCKYCGKELPSEYDTHDYLTFKAVGGDMTIGMTKTGDAPDCSFQYSKDKATWTMVNLNSSNDNIISIAKGETCYLRNGSESVIGRIASDDANCWSFTMTGNGTIEAGGNIMSLLDRTCKRNYLGSPHAFAKLFMGCEKLTTAPELPAKTLAFYCYHSMFAGTGITTAPKLPATDAIKGAYLGMFKDCKNLVTVPTLPAHAVRWRAYEDMFNGCSKITELSLGLVTEVENGNAFTRWLNGTAGETQAKLYVPEEMLDSVIITGIPKNWQLTSNSFYHNTVERDEDDGEVWEGEVTVRVNLTPASGNIIMWDPAASISIKRYSPESEHYEGKDYAEKTITINGNDVKWDAEKGQWYAEVEDIQGVSYTHYYYKASIDATKSKYRLLSNNSVVSTEEEANACYRETIAPFSRFMATQGTVKGKVALEWTVEDGIVDSFMLTRREYGANTTDETDTLKLKEAKSMSYIDEKAVSGKLYEYTITAMCNVRGKTYTAAKTTYGWNPYFATVSGKVQMPGGSLVPDAIKVKVKGGGRVTVNETKVGDDVIIPGYDMVYEDSLVTTDGVFSFDSIPYLSGGTKYSIEIDTYGKVEYAGHKGNSFDIEINDALYNANMDFVYADTKRVSGRVLYKNSTIPVGDCHFYMNGLQVLDANGEPVKTNNKGNFSFLVPTAEMTLQARKDGHLLENDGYIEGINLDKTEKEHAFRPSRDYDGLILADTTKVRLVGRLIGGSVQGKLPVGLGLSQNNIGDDLKMVLELEGDNTAQILFREDQPDLTSMSENYSQAVSDGTEVTNVNKTAVQVEKKRIVITPDVKTGEFSIDLAPTKYKVTELSATGYATLFADGEGFEVLDLTNTVEPKSLTYYNNSDKKTLTTAYNASYQKIYHTPVKVTYTQRKYGMEQKYLGADKITEMNLKGEKVSATVASYDKATGKVTYVFGYPVFEEGKTYQLNVSAHEDFYYNGDATTQPDIVHLDAGKLKVRNGLENSVSEQEYELDSMGTAVIDVRAGNTTFNMAEEDALRSLTMQVFNNGYYYEAEPLRAYVTGSRDKGKDVLTIDGDIDVLDVVRDPYGSRSYAYREAGTTYHWNRSYEVTFKSELGLGFEFGKKMTTTIGMWSGMGAGAFVGATTAGSTTMAFTIPIPLYDETYKRDAQYEMKLNTRVETSADPLDVGAMADVYIGAVNTMNIGRRDVFSVIDSATYNLVKPSIDAKAIRIVSEGKDAEGKPFYLAIAEKLDIRPGMPRQFIYTQKHIVNTIIPNLLQTYKSLILTGTREEVQAIANATNVIQYRLRDGMTIDQRYCYETIGPENAGMGRESVLTPENCLNSIASWLNVISTNETKKLAAKSSYDKLDSYNISAGTKITHTEQAQWYDRKQHYRRIVTKMVDGEKLNGELGLDVKIPLGTYNQKEVENDDQTTARNRKTTVTMDTPGFSFIFSLKPAVEAIYNNSFNTLQSYSAGSGYVLETNDDSYLNMDVYSAAVRDGSDNSYDVENGFTAWDFVSAADKDVKLADMHDYIFVVRGGAERQPWYAPDSTLYYCKGAALGSKTMRIDNPKIYIDQPVISNLPADEKAFFSIRLTNETELPTSADVSKYKPTVLSLFLDDTSTPDGAIITIDGAPVKNGVNFVIAPGQSITKTLTVERNGVAYDYDNIRLVLRDQYHSLKDNASLSVHYLPTSTPLRLTRPVDQWVMNTLSPVDEEGRYYMPVEITDFDINYANFDHIELQYKKKSEGDTKWVNLCSYYAQEDLYNKASGAKELIRSGTITNRFYGDADPMEMSYDLRAVSFCRLGTGFVTKTSNVMSGIKDTRPPVVFGMPKPADGILTFKDVISIPFNEPIAYNYLDETANFNVTSLTSSSDASYDASLRFPNYSGDEGDSQETASQAARNVPVTKVSRNLIGQDFTWECMVKMESPAANLFTISSAKKEDEENLQDGSMTCLIGDEIAVTMEGAKYVSQKLNTPEYEDLYRTLRQKLTHVAVTFTSSPVDNDSKRQVHFYIDGIEIPVANVINNSAEDSAENPLVQNTSYGNISIGSNFVGNMADARLWSKALPISELNYYSGKVLTGHEPSLMCYWPMNELTGNVLYDHANGADMYFERQTWQTTAGQHSLRIDGEAFRLQNTEEFLRYDNEDFTLSYWFMVDQDKTVADSVAILLSGSNLSDRKTTVYLDNENLNVKSGNNKFEVVERSQVMDGQWHNFMIIANKSLNNVALYFDGLLTRTVSGTDFIGLQQSVQLGSSDFYGNIDEFTLWHVAYPENIHDKVYRYSPTGDEMGLAYYLPFERDTVNSQNMHEMVFSTYNEVIRKSADGKVGAKKPAFEQSVLNDADMLARMDDMKRFCPVNPPLQVANLPFTWTASDNELQINIMEAAAKINHQYVRITVRGVEDLAGNTLVNPQLMIVYVNRNVLDWDEKKYNEVITYGKGTTVNASFGNKSGRNVNYRIEENCAWLKASKYSGRLAALENDNVEFEISEGLAPGEYSTTAYLVDEDNLSSPFTINLTVIGDEPEWAVVNDKDYCYSMNIIGQVKLKTKAGTEYLDADKRDIVAAFYDGVCIGKTNIAVNNEARKSNVNITVYGNKNMISEEAGSKKDITFLLWRANTNEVSILKPDTETRSIAFENNGMIGCPPDAPVVFTVSNERKQNISLEEGWNWMSLNLVPENTTGLNTLFESNNAFTEGDWISVNNASAQLLTDNDGNAVWSAGMNSVSNRDKHVYKVFVQRPTTVTVYGYSYPEQERFVQLEATKTSVPYKWNELPYLLIVDQPVNIAMSDFYKDKANVGTVIKGLREFAVMDENGQWVGSLQYMHPGQGYYTKYFGKSDTKVYYTNDENPYTASAKTRSVSFDTDETLDITVNDTRNHANSMPVIAQLSDDTDFCEGDVILAYTSSEVAAITEPTQMQDGRKLFFISLNAENGDVVRFAHIRGSEVMGKSANGVTFDDETVTGTLDVPYTIDFSAQASDNDNVFDVSGRYYGKSQNIGDRHGIFIINNQKISR